MDLSIFVLSVASSYVGSLLYDTCPPKYISKVNDLLLTGSISENTVRIKLAFREDPSFEEETQKYAKLTNFTYLKEQEKNLFQHLEQLKDDQRLFYTELVKSFVDLENSNNVGELHQRLLIDLNADPVSFIRELRLSCEPYMQDLTEDIELLLLYLLSQTLNQEEWQKGVHDLKVRTRVLSEIKLAARYNISANLKKHNNIGVAGRFVITEDMSGPETGFDPKFSAKQQANIIAYQLYKMFDQAGGGLDDEQVDQGDWDSVNQYLASEQTGSQPQLHRFEIDKRMTKDHPLLQQEVCEELLKILPDLPIAHFGLDIEKDETRLQSEVSLFYSKLYG